MKFQRLSAAYVATGGSSSLRETSKNGTTRAGGSSYDHEKKLTAEGMLEDTCAGLSPFQIFPQMYAWDRKPRITYARRSSGSDCRAATDRVGMMSTRRRMPPAWRSEGRDASIFSHSQNGAPRETRGGDDGKKPLLVTPNRSMRSSYLELGPSAGELTVEAMSAQEKLKRNTTFRRYVLVKSDGSILLLSLLDGSTLEPRRRFRRRKAGLYYKHWRHWSTNSLDPSSSQASLPSPPPLPVTLVC